MTVAKKAPSPDLIDEIKGVVFELNFTTGNATPNPLNHFSF